MKYVGERQKLYDLTYMLNLRKKKHPNSRIDLWLPEAGSGGLGEMGDGGQKA